MKTLKDIRDTVIADLDLFEEDFAENEDLDRWIREGVEIAESEIHNLYQDYFLANTSSITLSNTSMVDYPSDIYGNKIRTIIHSYDGDIYEVKKARNFKANLMYEMALGGSSTDTLKWFPINNAANGKGIQLTPATNSGSIIVYYIRNAKELLLDDDICDIDEFSRVIEQHTKTQAYLKDGDPRAADSLQLENNYIAKMRETLADMSADGDNEMDVDYSHYEESV